MTGDSEEFVVASGPFQAGKSPINGKIVMATLSSTFLGLTR